MSTPSTLDGNLRRTQHSEGEISSGSPYSGRPVMWGGSGQARDLADALAGEGSIKVGSDLASSCIEARARLLVLTNRTSFDLCSVAVPHGFNRSSTQSIVAAVGGGPHSSLAAELADWLSQKLGVPGRAVFGYTHPHERERSKAALDKTIDRLPGLPGDVVEVPSPAALVDALPPGTLLIVGAPGGSWFQRRFFGPGARIQAKAPAGTIVVTHNPERVFQVMQTPIAFGSAMRVGDALELSEGCDIAVAERGKLLGSVRVESLRGSRRDLELQQIMDTDTFLSADDEIGEAARTMERYGGGIIPVVDSHDRLVGCVSAGDLAVASVG